MAADEETLREALARVRKSCKAIRLLLAVIAGVFLVGWIVTLVVTAIGCFSGGSGSATLVPYVILYGAFVLATILLLRKMFNQVVYDDRVFAPAQASVLKTIALLSLIMFLIDAVFSVGVSYDVGTAITYGVDVNNGASEPTVNLNIGMLVFSGIMYSLSAIFRYAALLQQLSDDTV